MEIKYRSNNSGGLWWLCDKDWKKLEKAGWHVEWGSMYFCHSKYSFDKKPANKPEPCADGDKCTGHRKYDSAEEVGGDRYLGELAVSARKDFDSVTECLKEFEKVTGQSVTDEGCNCCGAPHGFDWEGGGCSGKDCMRYLYDDVPHNFREAVSRLNGGV